MRLKRVISHNMLDEDQPERVRIWSLEEAAEVVRLQLAISDPLQKTLLDIAGGKIGLIRPIVEIIADAVSYDPETEITDANFRTLAGAPEDDAQLETWRRALYERYQAQHRLRYNTG